MRAYGDSNFFTRVFLDLPETSTALSLLESSASEAPLPVCWLHRVEVMNAFQLHVFAARAPGQTRVTPQQAAAAHARFYEQLLEGDRFQQIVLPASELESLFQELSLRHTAKYGFRTYDVLHVASALLLDC